MLENTKSFIHKITSDSSFVLLKSVSEGRLKSTVFPATNKMFLHGIICLFVVALSISLNEVDSYFEIPLLLLISVAFFLLEKSAAHMQGPLENKPTDTAVTTIARTIEINIKQLPKEQDVPQPLQPARYYLS